MNYTLELAWGRDGDKEGFYVLHGGINWASVEGHASEWYEIAMGILDGKSVAFRRCASYPESGEWKFSSPRNACFESDIVVMNDSEARKFSSYIIEVLCENGEECVSHINAGHGEGI